MKSPKELQVEIRKPSSAINVKNRGKQQNGKDQRSRQGNQRYFGSISCKDGHNNGQKWYGHNRSRGYEEEVQEYTEELYKKDLHDQDNHDGVITHVQPNILECKVKWALGKTSL